VISAFKPDRLSWQVEATLGTHFPTHENFAFGSVREHLFANSAGRASIEPQASQAGKERLCR
jgi:hypothetical protein